MVFSIKRAVTGERTAKLLEMVADVEKVDATSFILRPKEPYADILSLFAKTETSILSKKIVEISGYDFTIPVGAGRNIHVPVYILVPHRLGCSGSHPLHE